ncbi:hypothetical protein A2V94_06225 [Candidatus Atribacteria bacterium RBG_16_35_8]|nr:MAG: hypothetical protein A2V94_06225 [Candidatus Atribacteria bacterium RBG_16_35_8]
MAQYGVGGGTYIPKTKPRQYNWTPTTWELESGYTPSVSRKKTSGGGTSENIITQTPAPVSTPYPEYSMPEFEVDLAGIWSTAGMMADNEINPQLAEIDRLLYIILM